MDMTDSTQYKASRYVNGGKTERTTNHLEWWDRRVWKFDNTDGIYTLEKIYEGNPQALATVIYNEPRLFWVILQYNNIINVSEEFIEGLELRIPSKERVQRDFLNGKKGGVISTRMPKSTISPIT